MMNRRVGLWLDLTKAVVVSITDDGEDIRRFTTSMEHYVRYSSSVPGDGSPEDIRDRRFWNHFSEYYDEVVAFIRDASSIQIFGPGEAKFELQRRLEQEGLLGHIVSIDEADTLIDRDIVRRVRARFPAKALFDIS